MAAGIEPFGERWQLPQPDALVQEWLADLAVIGNHCACPDGYHRVWGALKAIGRNIGIYWDAELIRSVVGPLTDTPSRILIAGSADRMCLRLLAGSAAAGAPHNFAVIDRCPAPLALVEEEARVAGLHLEVLQQGLDDPISLPAPADLIFAHYTLNFMESERRQSCLTALKAALAPAGRMVIAHRSGAERRYRMADADWAAAAAQRLHPLVAGNAEAGALLGTLLPLFAKHRAQRFVADAAEFETDLRAAGLTVIDKIDTGRAAKRSDLQRLDHPVEDAHLYVVAHG